MVRRRSTGGAPCSRTFRSSLDSEALARRLGELAGDERNVQVDFLLHLDEFDRRRAWADAGHGSLWNHCLRVLHLREGAAGRRIGAMKVLRRFPALEPALRDGRLRASTASLLGPVLTDENLDALVERAAFRTKAEVEEIVVALRPRPAPSNGIRRIAGPGSGQASVANATESGTLFAIGAASTNGAAAVVEDPAPDAAKAAAESPAGPPAPPSSTRTVVQPVAEDRWSVRLTLDAEGRAELEMLKSLLSHKIPKGDLTAILREAIRCGIEKYGKRKGAILPAKGSHQRERASEWKGAASDAAEGDDTASRRRREHIPVAVRRAVWKRDGGRCTYVASDGCRCESRWQLEFDHIIPDALGGTPTVDDLRLRCRAHNLLHAEQVFGREHMDQFRRPVLTIAGDS